jgi:hypothetical protein
MHIGARANFTAARMGQHCMHLHRYFSLAVFGFIYFWSVAAFGQSNDPPVKNSRQGICHETGSSVYARTTHFEPYGSMEECLKSGGRRSNAASPAAKDEAKSARSQLTPTRTLLAVIVVLITAGAVAWIWFSGRAKRRDKVQQFEDEARRKWEGHRRE